MSLGYRDTPCPRCGCYMDLNTYKYYYCPYCKQVWLEREINNDLHIKVVE